MAIRAPDGANKNSHILPTGQWYAPSAVSNDALIMQEYARVCLSMPEYAKVCQSMPEYAKVCQSMPEYASMFCLYIAVVAQKVKVQC